MSNVFQTCLKGFKLKKMVVKLKLTQPVEESTQLIEPTEELVNQFRPVEECKNLLTLLE